MALLGGQIVQVTTKILVWHSATLQNRKSKKEVM
jgi:hypothetical protein